MKNVAVLIRNIFGDYSEEMYLRMKVSTWQKEISIKENKENPSTFLEGFFTIIKNVLKGKNPLAL